MEISQFTYFQQVGGIECNPVPLELTYGLELMAMFIQGIDNVYELDQMACLPIRAAKAMAIFSSVPKLNFQAGILRLPQQICCSAILKMQKKECECAEHLQGAARL